MTRTYPMFLPRRPVRSLAIITAASLVVGTVGVLGAHASTTWAPLGSGVNGSVFEITADGNGGVYAGGQFTTAGGQSAKGIAHWNGSTWSALGSGVASFTSPYVSAIDVNGSDVYVGGAFDNAGGITNTNGIARWNGSSWSALGTGIDPGGIVFALAHSGSILYAGGNFTGAGGIAANNIAEWNGSAWSALGTGTNSPIQSMAIAPNGDLYVGGDFTNVDGVSVSSLARWDGSTWSDVGGGVDYVDPSSTPLIESLTFDATGNLFVGGNFDLAGTGSLPVRNIAKWNGSSWSSVGAGVDGSINDLVFDSSGRLYAAYYGNTSFTGDIDRWDGTSWTTLPSGADSSINALAFANATSLIAGGGFTEIAGVSASLIASYSLPAVALPDGPSAPLQQFGVSAGTTAAECGSLAPPAVDWPALVSLRSAGWSVSFAQWPNNGAGGWVCTRQPIYTASGWGFS